jgi:hypothetical protein
MPRLKIAGANIWASDAVSEWAGRARRSLKFCEIQINSVAGVQTDTDRAA